MDKNTFIKDRDKTNKGNQIMNKIKISNFKEIRILYHISNNSNLNNNFTNLNNNYGDFDNFFILKYLFTNITINFIERHLDKPWDWSSISENIFIKEKELFYQEWYRKYLAVFRIQQYYNRAIDNPAYKLCRDVFNKKFEEWEEAC